MKIVVTGSLGRIGRPLTEELVARGHEVIVISSDPNKQAEIEALGAKAAIGEIEDIDFLTAAFTGADAVHTMVPPSYSSSDPLARSRQIGDCFAEAIRRSGVQKVLYVSSYGADLSEGTGLILGSHYVENALQALNLRSLTLLRATYIYYNVYAYVGMIKSTGTIFANYGGDDLQILVSPKDIAMAAAEELEGNSTGTNIRYVASDERTCNEMAQVLGEAIGKPDLKWVTISNEEMQKGMEANGLPAPVAEIIVEMYHGCHTGLLQHDYLLNRPKELGKVKLEDFAKEFAAVYNQK